MDIDCITKWFNKNTKLEKINDLKKLNNYICYFNNKNKITNNILNINYSSDYEFRIFDLDNMNVNQMNIRPENIFKLNFLIIVKKMNKYFNEIDFPGLKIFIDYERAGDIDLARKIKSSTYKHDVYIKIEYTSSKKYQEKEIVFEYFESIHDRIKDNEKKISSIVQLDSYIVYEEKNKNYNKFIKKTIFEIFLNICCVLDDKYILAKIIYFENYIMNKNIKQDTLMFNKIIEWKKNDEFDFENFFDSSGIINPDDDKPFKKINSFIDYLKNNYEITIKFNKGYLCEFNYFIEIINVIDSNCSPKIYDYRKTFTNMLLIMLEASNKIIELNNKKSNLIKFYLPMFLDNTHLHIKNWKNEELQKNIYYTLEKKFKNSKKI